MSHATFSNRSDCCDLSVGCLVAVGLRPGMAVDDASLLLDHILQHQLLYTLIRLVSVRLPALVDRVLFQQLCPHPGRL